MIQLIYGSKGSGKTKRLIEMVNAEVNATDGSVVFMDDNKRYMYDVDRAVRFVDVTEYNVGFGGETLWVFVRNACAELRYIGHLYGRIFTYDRENAG